MRLSLRAVLIALVAFVAIGGLISVLPAESGPAKNWHEGSCIDEPGVTLVIDFGTSANKSALVRCAKSFTGTGWDIFAATETSVSGTAQYPTGFVCRVEGYPNADEQDCKSTPSYEQGNWAYFFATADTGDNWMFSGSGSQMRSPKCGSVEGWRFVEAGEPQSQSFPREKPKPFRCD